MYRFRDTLPIDISRKTISGDLVTIDNSEEMGVVDSLEVSLSPIQDLNGYDKPWVGGAGVNLFPYLNARTATFNGVTFSCDGKGTLTMQGTATANDYITLTFPQAFVVPDGADYKFCMLNDEAHTDSVFRFVNGSTIVDSWSPKPANRETTYAGLSGKTVTGIRLYCAQGETYNLTMKPMFVPKSTTVTGYIPYSNICPISGRTEVVTEVCGKNFATDAVFGYSGVSRKTYGTGMADLIAFLNALPYGTYTISADMRVDAVGSTSKAMEFGFYGSTTAGTINKIITRTNPPIGTVIRPSFTVTISESNKVNSMYIYASSNTAGDLATISNWQIELGSTATSYEPYQGTTYTTALGRTVYGGTLDVVSGELTVTHFCFTDSGDNGWVRNDDGSFYKWYTQTLPVSVHEVDGCACNYAPYVISFNDMNVFARTNGLMSLGKGWGTIYPDVASLQAQFAQTPLQVVYKLATPQTYQLTPQQIELLVGENHLFSDGEISVVWHKDLTKGRILPTEAVSINGQYIENVLDGYRTLYTKGRESLGAKLETYSIGTADGEKFKNKRYPARTITVGFQLIGANPQDFRQKFNNLNNLLSIDEADFIFNDETDKFFSGYPIMDASVEAGQDSVKGEWKIYCTYPFKRSVEPIKLTMEDATVTDTTATFTIDYKGARPARPVLRAKFAGAKSGGSSSEDGDCGFVAFMDGEENIIQLGNPEIVDLDEYVSAETLLNKEFVNVSDWTRTGGHTYKGTVTGSVSTSDTVDAFWNGGAGQTQTYAKPSYGSGSDLHGAILWKNTAGAVNFTMNMVHRLCCANPNETGVFECGAYNHDTGVLVAGFVIDKSANGTTGIVRYIVNDKQVGTDQIDLSYYNTHFGYCNRTPVYVEETVYDPYIEEYVVIKRHKKRKRKQRKYITKSRVHRWARTRTVFSGWNYSQSNLNSSIQKDGSYVYFQVGNLPMRTFNVPAVAQVIAHDASVYMGTYGTALNTNMIHSLLFRREAGVPFSEQPNVFTAGDIVEADCNEATVYIYRDGSIGGHLEPQYGALGNDWEDFMLTSGTNVIRATWSEWVNPTYKPQIEIEYNEVYI